MYLVRVDSELVVNVILVISFNQLLYLGWSVASHDNFLKKLKRIEKNQKMWIWNGLYSFFCISPAGFIKNMYFHVRGLFEGRV